MLDTTPESRAAHVLKTFGDALERGDIDAAVAQFADTCYWRDLVSFTWNIRTMEGPDQIRAMLESQLGSINPSAWALNPDEAVTDEGGITTAWFSFETGVSRGYGLVRLQGDKIWTLLTSMVELKGHEEPKNFHRPLGAKHGHGKHRPT